MRVDLLGLEGSFPADVALAWGVAVLRVDNRTLNPVTASYGDVFSLQSLAAEGHVTLLDDSVELMEGAIHSPLVVAAVTLRHDDEGFFIREPGKMAGLVAHRRQKRQLVYVFQDRKSYDLYADDVVSAILCEALFAEPNPTEQRRLARLALTARADHAHAQALRAALSERPTVAARVGRAVLKSDAARAEFDELFEALTSTDTDYGLHYRDAPDLPDDLAGPTRGGGFDVGNAVKTLNSVREAHRELVRPSLERTFQFLNRRVPEYRFKTMVAASAELHFSTSVPGESIGERVGRHLSVRRLERVLRGEEIPGVDPVVASAIASRVAVPVPGVVLAQKPLGGEEERVFVGPPAAAVPVLGVEFRMLAVQSGQVDDAARVELHLSARRKVLLSTRDNGRGGRPDGVLHLLESQSALWQPLVATIERRVMTNAKEAFYLLRLERLLPGADPQLLDGAPSTVVNGAFVSGLQCAVRREPDGTVTSSFGNAGRVPLPAEGGGSSIYAMQELFAGWDELVRVRELRADALRSFQWHPPVRPPALTAMHRVVLAVGRAGGRAPVSDVVARIWSDYGAQVRINNTRREVARNSELMNLDGAFGDEVALTEAGMHFYRIMSVVRDRAETESYAGAPIQ